MLDESSWGYLVFLPAPSISFFEVSLITHASEES
jgi:hypothetical protein